MTVEQTLNYFLKRAFQEREYTQYAGQRLEEMLGEAAREAEGSSWRRSAAPSLPY